MTRRPMGNESGARGQYIASFDIKTWGLRVIAVCHIPDGWTASAGKNAGPEGVLSDTAGEGVAFLVTERLHQLTNFFLVQVDNYHPNDRGGCAKNCTPASFAGDFYIGEYGSEDQPRPQRVLLSNIELEAAARCPDPR